MATSSVVPYEAKTARKVELNEIIPPVDFSFLKIASVDECESEEPRDNSPRKQRAVQKKKEEEKDDKSDSLCLKLNNNELKDVNNIMSIAEMLFQNPSSIGWIDLSFNSLTHIDPVLTQFENLKILYLHGNSIEDVKEVNKLAVLPRLIKLCLHGNPMENVKGYRQYVLSFVPNLVVFDFSRVTKADRATANTWKNFNNPQRQKKIKNNDD
ncbi:leucine-rich repeat-containing protein 51 [Aplysia californica]|uniref:Leucine-rich repeat-containing protein 51 n=1 Tax=Aplysia californica TaxID=6500 RepID=A0ABM0JM59_APLCA|nr:leucine-rich repeat-containing protein 51 [Aplysia californica]